MNILVTGGAGYIGSHITRALIAANHRVVVLDDLSTGHASVIVGEYVHGSIGDVPLMTQTLRNYAIDAIIHCAGLINVSDSMAHPADYRRVNVDYSQRVLEAMHAADTRTIVFSSSCSVYGTPQSIPVTEDAPYHPESVYADTKRQVEELIQRDAEHSGTRFALLRYFNACGASSDSSTGEWHDPETHLIPNVIRAALNHRPITLFGNDYDTPDGTCIRDYVHVEDLADAHVRAVELLHAGTPNMILNLGAGKGYSNTEIVRAVERVLNVTIPIEYAPRRAGDAARIEGSYDNAQRLLGWTPQHTLESIIQTAIRWEQKKQRS